MADKLISANALATVIRDDPYIHGRAYARVRDHIDDAPDAVKHGRWQEKRFICMDGEVMLGYRCSRCMLIFDVETNYCPNCGADMRGTNNDK